MLEGVLLAEDGCCAGHHTARLGAHGSDGALRGEAEGVHGVWKRAGLTLRVVSGLTALQQTAASRRVRPSSVRELPTRVQSHISPVGSSARHYVPYRDRTSSHHRYHHIELRVLARLVG